MAYIFNDDKGKVPVTASTTGAITVTAGTDYTTAKLRNVILLTGEPTSTIGSNGDICIIYTA